MVTKNLLKLFENVEDVAIDQELDENVLDSDFLYSFLESGICQDNIITVPINEQNVLILNLCMASCNTGVFEILTLISIVELNLTNSIFLVLPL